MDFHALGTFVCGASLECDGAIGLIVAAAVSVCIMIAYGRVVQYRREHGCYEAVAVVAGVRGDDTV
jgi:hypothetical protein